MFKIFSKQEKMRDTLHKEIVYHLTYLDEPKGVFYCFSKKEFLHAIYPTIPVLAKQSIAKAIEEACEGKITNLYEILHLTISPFIVKNGVLLQVIQNTIKSTLLKHSPITLFLGMCLFGENFERLTQGLLNNFIYGQVKEYLKENLLLPSCGHVLAKVAAEISQIPGMPLDTRLKHIETDMKSILSNILLGQNGGNYKYSEFASHSTLNYVTVSATLANSIKKHLEKLIDSELEKEGKKEANKNNL